MTKIKYKERPSYRESSAVFAHREICVALEPKAIVLRLKKGRVCYRLPMEVAFLEAARLEANLIKKQKKKGTHV